MRNKIILTALVTATLAFSAWLGVRGALSGGALSDDAAEGARKKEFEAAMRRGNLSLYEAKYARTAAPTALTAATAATGEAGR